MLNITVTGDRETIVKFDKVSAALHAQILNVTKKYAVNLQQHVKGDKLSGQVLTADRARCRARSSSRSMTTAKPSMAGFSHLAT